MKTLRKKKGSFEVHTLPRGNCPACGGLRLITVVRDSGRDKEIRETVCKNGCTFGQIAIALGEAA